MKRLDFKKKTAVFCFLIVIVSIVFWVVPAMAQGDAVLQQDSKEAVVKEVGPGVYRVNDIKVYMKEKKIEFPVYINMTEGLLEYLLVEKNGKVHESLLVTTVQPYDIQIALLMLGLEPTKNPLSHQGEDRIPEGAPVRIRASQSSIENAADLVIENWVVNRADQKIMQPMDWVFTGSVIFDGQFMAQMEKSIISIYHDPIAIIDNTLKQGAHDEFWFVNTDSVLPQGTELILTIQKVQKGED